MTPIWQISRNSAFWLLLAFLASTLPLVRYLPLWTFLIAAVALLWRVAIYRGRWGAPGKILKVLLVLVCAVGVQFSFTKIYGLEPMATLLICGFSLKLLEMSQRRDALVVIFLAYFVAIVLALFDQGFVTALIIFWALLLITASLHALHQSSTTAVESRSFWGGLRLLIQAVPLMLLFFIIMPRLGPLWAVPTANSGTTGMSDSLALGDVARLGKSSEIAFRVNFNGEPPPRNQLYWRGLTLSRFDGKNWTRSEWGYRGSLVNWYGEADADWRRSITPGERRFAYQVVMEKQKGNWLYGLWIPEPDSPGVGLVRDMTLVNRQFASGRQEYAASSVLDAEYEVDGLEGWRRQIELMLPDTGNPRTRMLAQEWAAEAESPESLSRRLLDYYRNRFFYTLTPGTLGRDSIDDFLFSSQRGFCEHFAASFVFFMRAAGVPARIVTGYQGGEFHPERGHLTVRQYDAHAWAEIWLEGKGWVQVDPTAAVAPERILSSFIDMMNEDELFADSPMSLGRFRGISWVNRLRLQLEGLEYSWAKWVLGYQNQQAGLLQKLLGGTEAWKIAVLFIAGAGLALLPVLISFIRQAPREKRSPVDELYWQFCQKLASEGYSRQQGEAPLVYSERCSRQLPELARGIKAVTREYMAIKYGRNGSYSRLRAQVKQFRRTPIMRNK